MTRFRQLVAYDSSTDAVVVLAKCTVGEGLLPGQIGWYEDGRYPRSDLVSPWVPVDQPGRLVWASELKAMAERLLAEARDLERAVEDV